MSLLTPKQRDLLTDLKGGAHLRFTYGKRGQQTGAVIIRPGQSSRVVPFGVAKRAQQTALAEGLLTTYGFHPGIFRDYQLTRKGETEL